MFPDWSWSLRFLLVASLTSGQVLLGWSDTGHRVVAAAAQEILSDNAKRRLSYLLGKDFVLAEVATWADEIIVERPETEAWHSITIPPGAEGVDLKRDCPLGDCLPVKVRDCIGIVRLAIRTQTEIVDSLKMLISLAADMHQPMRNGYPPGQGMEDHIVEVDGVQMSMFDAWEHGLVDRLGTEEEVLQRVSERVASAESSTWRRGTYRDWTWETHQIATGQVYASVGDGSEGIVVDGSWLSQASETVVDQLAKSAVRLAHMFEVTWP